MKFKGFWKSLWELNKQSFAWLKDYWFAYTILLVVTFVISFMAFGGYALFGYLKPVKVSDDDIEDFLK